MFLGLALIPLEQTPIFVGASVTGRYNLFSAAGQNLPAVVSQNASMEYKQEVTGGYIELMTNRKCTVLTEYRYTNKDRTTTSSTRDEGKYEISGETVIFTFGSDQLRATLKGEVLTVRADVELVYRKK
jgi:hypothetical protein